MRESRVAVALLALTLSATALPSAGLAQDMCQNPSFRIGKGSPFPLPIQQVATQPTALAAGTYIARPGVQPGAGCGCDLAVGLKTLAIPSQGFLALLHGNDDGSFTKSPDTLRELDGIPVAIATGRFRQNLPAEVVVVATSPLEGGNGKVQVFVPDATGTYPKTPTATFAVGASPADIAVGDFNGDGKLDVAVINQDDSTVSILLGDGTGSFVPNVFTVGNLGGVPESVTAGKFSGTSAADDVAIAVLKDAGGATQVGIVIVPGSPAGTFTPKSVIPLGARGSTMPSIAAANLSGPSEGASGRRMRDLAIAFTDVISSGAKVGRIKVLLGRDAPGGGFDVNAAQTLDIGATQPRSVKVLDIDNDGVVDLVVSAFTQPSQLDGTLHLFQGHAAPGANVGFQPNNTWHTATTLNLPRTLVAGRFGNHSPGSPLAKMGLAAINAPDLNSILVFQGDGQGSFTEPSLVTTPFSPDDHMFVAGDFHSNDGSSPVQDLAFITKSSNGRNVLSVRLSNGAGGFAPIDPAQPSPAAGISPVLMVAGQFVAGQPHGVAIIDQAGAVGQQPLLKIFLGQGRGRITPGDELALDGVGRPQAIAVGHFRGPDKPLDIAIAGDTTPPGTTRFSGKITLLSNDGKGGFSVAPNPVPLNFVPGTLVVSSRLRPGGKVDLLIRDANQNRFQFLASIPGGGFRFPNGASDGFFPRAGNVNALLVGNVAHDTDDLDDVVTFDSDMTLRIFVNSGDESFNLQTLQRGNDPHFVGARPPYVLAKFGSGKPALAASVVRDGNLGLLLLQRDSTTGKLAPATGEVPLQAVRGTTTDKPMTDIVQGSITVSRNVEVQMIQTMAAQFHSALHGNSLPDLIVISQTRDSFTTAGNCPGDMTPLPKPGPPPPTCPAPATCPNENPGKKGAPKTVPCFSGECCNCTTGPKEAQCPNSCTRGPVPFQAFCDAFLRYTPVAAVYANTCAD